MKSISTPFTILLVFSRHQWRIWKNIFLVTSFLLVAFSLTAQTISGTVFRDFDGDGVKDTNEPGIGGVTVRAFDNDDPVNTPTATATTNSTGPTLATVGTYTLSGLTTGVTYRLIGSNFPGQQAT